MGFGEGPRGSSSDGASTLLRSLVRAVRAGEVVGILPGRTARTGRRGATRRGGPGPDDGGAPLHRGHFGPTAPGASGAGIARSCRNPSLACDCRFGETLVVPKGSSEEALTAALSRLQEELHRLDDGLDAEFEIPH